MVRSIPATWFALFVGLVFFVVLELVYLPDMLNRFRPEWVVLFCIYCVLHHSDKFGFAGALVLGFLLDVISGANFGVHGLALCIVTYLVLGMHQRLKMFPSIQQAALVFFLTGIYLMLLYVMSMILGNPANGLDYLWQALSSAVVWPFVVAISDRVVLFFR